MEKTRTFVAGLMSLCFTFFADVTESQTWIRMPGQGVQISARDLEIPAWVVNSSHQLYHFDSAVNEWIFEPHILYRAVGIKNAGQAFDGTVWMVSTLDDVFRRRVSGSPQYDIINGSLAQVAGRSLDEAIGVNSENHIYHYIEDIWQQMPGAAIWTAIGEDGSMWIVHPNERIYRWNESSRKWVRVYGPAAVNIDVYDQEHVIITNAQDQMYVWNGSEWRMLSGSCKQASITVDHYYCVDDAGNIYTADALDDSSLLVPI